MDLLQPIAIAEGLWWVGSGSTNKKLQCNPYLLSYGGATILFDPGSVLDWESVKKKVEHITSIEDLDAIVCSHQDPDLCSSLPLWEKHGFKGTICCHERTSLLLPYYGITSSFYTVNTHDYRYILPNGSHILFLFSPYLHFPGAIMTYLPAQKALLSGDIFGAITNQWTLFAKDGYEEGMKTFHEHYMPSHELLSLALSQLDTLDISCICPQHGSIINKEVKSYIQILKDLPCGFFTKPLRKQLLEVGGVVGVCNIILQRLFVVYGVRDVRDVFTKSSFQIDYTHKVIHHTEIPEGDVWETFFNQIYDRKGVEWISLISSLVETLCKQYSMPLPSLFFSTIYKNSALATNTQFFVQQLENEKISLESHLKEIEESLYRDPITHLYNHQFHDLYTLQEVQAFMYQKHFFSILLLRIDNLVDINLDFGSEEGNITLRNLVYLIKQQTHEHEQIFRLAGGVIAIHWGYVDQQKALQQANILRERIIESDIWIVPITVSMALYHAEELPSERKDPEEHREIAIQTALYRLKVAHKKGKNQLIHKTKLIGTSKSTYDILLIDHPSLQRDLIKDMLIRNHYHVIIASDGKEGLQTILEEKPDLIICELLISKIGGLSLRKHLLSLPEYQNIPFMMMSIVKREAMVRQTLSLGIEHFLLRPVMLVELEGLIPLVLSKREISI